MSLLYPSLMAANQLKLGEMLAAIDPYCAGYHIDIMDGHYVPNLAFNPLTVKAITQNTCHPLWMHWMVENPLQILTYFSLPEQTLMSFHIEKNKEINKCLNSSKENKFKVGIVLAPKTPIVEALPFLTPMIDDVLIMSVEPGFSGQKFIPETYEKIKAISEYRTHRKLRFAISVDGGVNVTNLPLLVKYGVDRIALASAIFSTKYPAQTLQDMRLLVVNNTV